jgi:RNA polymerase sigma-70 factor, ECF subfamily
MPNRTMHTDQLTTATDGELVSRMLENDGRAWRTFVVRYRPLISFNIRAVLAPFRVHPIDPDDAYAAVMSSLLAHDMSKLRVYDESRGTKLSSWISMLTRHATWDLLREARRLRRLHEALAYSASPRAACDPLEQLMSRECVALLDAARADLSARDQTFFELAYVECAQPARIASEMGISIKTVYTKNHKVRGKLQLSLG